MTVAAFRSALEEVLRVDKGTLQDSDTRDTVKDWTSLADVQILSMISSELGVEPDQDVIEAETCGDLIQLLESKGAFR